MMLRHASGGEVVLGVTSAGSYQRRVVAGVYDLYYAQDTSSLDAPRNANARLGELMAVSGAPADIDIARVRVSGEITLGGAPPPDSEYQDGHLFLREIETGDSVLLANTRAGYFAAPVVPGQYEIVYAADHAAGPLPANTGAVIGDVTVDDTAVQQFSIDVPVLAVGGAITLDGETRPPRPPTSPPTSTWSMRAPPIRSTSAARSTARTPADRRVTTCSSIAW
ncbi:MAG: hypothetical protein U0168_06380 [Nannocystaceae bacterium]